MINPIELVIFDCDGVLIDSERLAVRLHVTVGAELGWPLTEAEVIEKFGRTGIYRYFEGRVFSAGEVARGKPAPDLFLHAARRMGVHPSACVVVEDSKYGVQAARAAGMCALGYAGGLTPARWLEGPNTSVFDDMRELPRLLAGA
ncbi:HAD-IA family hydrolase [Streptosporangium sp. NPDC049376]|uniref:HAD-IA family hydrolase n=1 Tax=Streptosporangium sp. NPDC049376 TaxID=3366192 RepID=UPI0037BB339A